MPVHLLVDNAEYWRDVACSELMEATPNDMPTEFSADMAMIQRAEIQISRIRSVPHRWERLEKHVRHSRHNDFVVYLQTKGSTVQVQDGREILLREGEITCKDATRPMTMKLNEDFEQILVHIPRSIVLSAFGPTERFTSRELRKASPLGSVIHSFLWSVAPTLDKLSGSAAHTLCATAESLVMALLAEQASVKLDHHSWGENALRYRAEAFIQSHNQHADLTPQTIAFALNVSLRSLQNAFRAADTTPSGYIWECRLRNSEQELTNSILSSLNISEIALRNGFADSAHFCRRFKERFGMAPRDYRAWKRSRLISLS